MVYETSKKIDKVILSAKDVDFHPERLYKLIKETADDYDYTYREKKHELKPDKYGDRFLVHITLVKEYDDYAEMEFNIELVCSSLHKVAEKQRGNISLIISNTLTYDRENTKELFFFVKFFRTLYFKYGGEERIEERYIKPARLFLKVLKNRLKEEGGFYV